MKLATINLSGGSAVGGVQRIRFEKGRRARLIVYSDSTEVVEIPDYGLTRRVEAGSSARFYFVLTVTLSITTGEMGRSSGPAGTSSIA